MTSVETYSAAYIRNCRIRKELGQLNKAAIFAALAAAEISLVIVTFDGEGDSGQIQDVTATRNEQSVPLPHIKVKLQQAVWDKPDPETSDVELRDAIEALCFDLLEDDHAGWENNDGAFGEFRLDVTAHTVELEFNFRFTDTFTTNLTY